MGAARHRLHGNRQSAVAGRQPRHRAAPAVDPPMRRRRPRIPPGLDTVSFAAWIGDGAALDANRRDARSRR